MAQQKKGEESFIFSWGEGLELIAKNEGEPKTTRKKIKKSPREGPTKKEIDCFFARASSVKKGGPTHEGGKLDYSEYLETLKGETKTQNGVKKKGPTSIKLKKSGGGGEVNNQHNDGLLDWVGKGGTDSSTSQRRKKKKKETKMNLA